MADQNTILFAPNEEQQLTMDQMTQGLTEEAIMALLETPSVTMTEVQADVPVEPRPARATRKGTTKPAAPQGSKTPVALQATQKDSTMTITKTKTIKPNVTNGWETVNSRDAKAVGAYAAAHGLTPAGTVQLVASLTEQTFLSPVQLYDVTKQFQERDETTQMAFADFLVGAVACTTGTNSVQRGFQFTPGVEQKIILAKGMIFTELQEPAPVTGLMQGPDQALFVAFPETIPGVPGQRGTNGVTIQGYRPLLRLMGQHITDGFDGTEEGGAITNVFFQVKARGVGRFKDLVPNFIYESALKAGLTDKDLLVRVTNTYEINRRSQHRAMSPRNRAGFATAQTNAGTGAPLNNFAQTSRDPATSFRNSVGNGTYDPSA